MKRDPARVKKLERLAAIMEASKRKEASGFDAYYEALGEIIDAELWIDAGYDSRDGYLRAIVKEDPRTAMRNVRVARHASPDEEVAFGVSLLDATLDLIEAKAGGPIKGRLPVHFARMLVDVEDAQGNVSRLPLAKVSVEQLRTAKRKLDRTSKKEHVFASPTERALVQQISRTKALRGVTVHVSDGKLKVGNVPLHAIEDLISALRAAHRVWTAKK